jgi:hypothetical protein
MLAIAAVLALHAAGQTPEPDAAARNAILARMKDAAVNYAERLQDFLCIELIKRSKEDSGPFKHWQALDTQEREVGYISRQEHYRVLSVNGKPPNTAKVKAGYCCRAENSERCWDTFSIPNPPPNSSGITWSSLATGACACSGTA